MDQTPHTWHYGLMARWWAEFIVAEPAELAYYQAAIERSGQPALDLGCGAGRLLHELNLPRRYRTIFACGVVGLGATRAQDRLAFRRVFDQLLPGGTFVFSHELPYSAADQVRWQRWLPGQRADIPRAWPADGGRRATGDGDELETIDRLAAFDPLGQRMTFETRVRLWHDGTVVTQEEHRLAINLYFAQELVLMLEDAGFADVAIEGDYTGVPASADDGNVVYVARRAADRLTR